MKYSAAWLIVITLLAAAYAYFLYKKDDLLAEVSLGLIRLMAFFRFCATWLILFLLLGIVLEHFDERKEKPIVFLAHDNSESIVLTKDSLFYKNEYVEELKKISKDLSTNFDVVEYSFSDLLENGLRKDYTGKLTDISEVFDQIFEQYSNRNIGAIILSTDGIYNTGANPIYSVAKKSFIPIYTIGLGDTNIVRDVKIDGVNHNDIAFLGNEFPVEIVFAGTKVKGEKVQISIYQKDKLIHKDDYKFVDDFEQSRLVFNLRAQGVGFQKYTAVISEVQNEFTVRNNSMTFYIEVIDGRQKILIANQSPHPDIAALRFVIENNQNYQIDVKTIKDVTSISEYDLVIVHNYVAENKLIDEGIANGSVPFLLINGLATDMRSLQNLKVGFNGVGSSSEELGFVHNVGFKDILLQPKTIQVLSNAPPLHAPFGNFTFSKALDILAFQKVGNVQLDNPLIYFTEKGKSKMGVIMGEGIWRWRLYDQMRNSNTQTFEDFIAKLITYLAIKDNKDPFRINIKNEFFENEEIFVGAELYNKSFELINEPEVNFEFTNEIGRKFESTFLRTANAYQLSLGKLPSGIYSWLANTNFQGKKYSKSGSFLVSELKLEWLSTTADYRLLRNIATNSGGKFYFPKALASLSTDINESDAISTVVYQEKAFNDLIDYKWLFFAIIVFISVEWFFRKYNGAY